MILEKIKEIWEEKKIVVIALLTLIGAVGFYFYNNNEKVDNSSVLTSQTEQKDSSQNLNQTQSMHSQSNSQSFSSNKVTVDISGAVKHGGVYTLKNGARLNDLIEAAGGLHKRAQVRAINRAQLLKDQDQIYVPYEGEKVDLPATNSTNSANSQSGSSTSGQSNGEQVHLNSATVADLQKLNGIGEKKAEQIIQYRDQNGGFKQIEDLTKVSGIGDKTFEKLKDQLAL